jgi:mannose-6-phosphate isomerase-like protein (cupin superfamily)
MRKFWEIDVRIASWASACAAAMLFANASARASADDGGSGSVASARVVSPAQIRVAVAAMKARMGKSSFAYQPLLIDGQTKAAVEYWTAPGKPAIHPDEAEYATVIERSGALVAGGTMADPHQTQPGLVEGSRINGGTTRRLSAGDVFLVPAGMPHSFGVDDKLVLLGIKIPVAR